MRFLYLSAFLLLGALFNSCGDDTPPPRRPLAEVVRQIQPNATLEGIEPRITAATNRAFMRKSASPLTDLRDEITSVKGAEYERLVSYWAAFTDFQIGVFGNSHNDDAGAKAALDRGIALLESVERKNAEELSLLAFLQGFSTEFASDTEVIGISDKAQANIAAAMKLNPDNLRTQYVLGCLDYYTPKEFGGGKVAKIHLSRATNLPANSIDSPYLPSWGKAEAYELLVRHYTAEGQLDVAEATLEEGLALYPDDHQLSLLVSADTE
ncbi:hypothetical protein FUA23_18665 [Neolewinella aurantiaca]|uniref:Tetratricopeptide repeat protein n=1 Tax=Neolewinella aurantiaca TaxID=2602767 RepID=A0A5C7FP33_9BACT|nr:hypothetical protein [Neolewinella aurantiaca]TXF87116.1 hypothetical protein FUA23_18665 [Neolewinella aurantiaca]